jgi:hypothetical protein
LNKETELDHLYKENEKIKENFYSAIEHIKQLQKENDELNQQIKEYQEKIIKLEQLLKEKQTPLTSRNSSKPPSQDIKPNIIAFKTTKVGAKKGHKGYGRKNPDSVDKIEEYSPSVCSKCSNPLKNTQKKIVAGSKIISEIEINRLDIKLVRYKVKCDKCGHWEEAQYPSNISAQDRFGPTFKSIIAYLCCEAHISREGLKKFSEKVLKMNVGLGSITNIIKYVGEKAVSELSKVYEQMITNSANSVIGSDETVIRVNGRNMYGWVFQTKEHTYYHIGATRSEKELSVLGGARFWGWVSDRYNVQLKGSAEIHQICHAHLMRNLQYFIDSYGSIAAYKLQELLRRAEKVRDEQYVMGKIDEKIYNEEQGRILKEWEYWIEQLPKDGKGKRFIKSMRKHKDKIFAFWKDERICWHNNDSERALRRMVVHRKIIGSFRSIWGAKVYAAISSVVETAKKQKKNVFEVYRALLGPPLLVS